MIKFLSRRAFLIQMVKNYKKSSLYIRVSVAEMVKNLNNYYGPGTEHNFDLFTEEEFNKLLLLI